MKDAADPILIGVDGGGTGCRAVVGTRAKGVLGQAKGGPANVSAHPEQAIANIMETVRSAAKSTGIAHSDLNGAFVHLGLAGVMTEADSAEIAAAVPFDHCRVTDDRPTTITGALAGQDGFLLAIGTGTIVAACRNGTFDYVGGWGFHVADQASGAWLGRAALERIMLCHDGLEDHSALTQVIFDQFDNDPNKIVTFSISATPGDYAGFARDVVDAAGAGDPFAGQLMTRGADYLARGLVRLGFHPGDTLCLTGGLGARYARFLPQGFAEGLIEPKGSAAEGAFEMASAGADKLWKLS